jgi:hypothetical protein
VDGSCKNGCCTLVTYVVDYSGCACEDVCYTTGGIYIAYLCVGEEDCYGNCFCKTTTATQLLKRMPICEDTGWWPPGPECNEDEDCTISGWNDTFGEAYNTCSCVPYPT